MSEPKQAEKSRIPTWVVNVLAVVAFLLLLRLVAQVLAPWFGG